MKSLGSLFVASVQRGVSLLTLAGALSAPAMANVPPGIPVIGVRAAVPETREPFCDPAICDAAPPPPAVFVLVRLGGDLTRELSVSVGFAGSASNGVDYAELPGFVVFRAGASSAEVRVMAAFDQKVEGDEGVVLEVLPDPSMGPIARYTVDPLRAAARVVIHDGDSPVLPTVAIAATVPETTEPAPNIRVMPGMFTLKRTGDTAAGLRVWVRYEGTALAGIDYATLPSIVEFAAGAATVDLRVGPFSDALVEGDETVVAFLTPSPLAIPPTYQIDPTTAAARVIIHDSTTPPSRVPVVTITAPDGFAREGTNNTSLPDPAVFVIQRMGPTNDPLKVEIRVGGTAVNGEDYREITSPVVIPAGARAARVVIVPLPDRVMEGLETVLVGLVPSSSDPAEYAVGIPGRAAAVIADAGVIRPPCVRLADGMFNLCWPVLEANGQCFRVEISRDLVEWFPLVNVPVAEDEVRFVDPDAPERPRAFYRIVPVPCDP